MFSSDIHDGQDLYNLSLELPDSFNFDIADQIATSLEDLTASLSILEKQKPETGWILNGILVDNPDPDHILARLRSAIPANYDLGGFDLKDSLNITPLPKIDWLQHVYEAFPPFDVGCFFLHGSHFEGEPPAEQIPLQIDAATAFGSGEHPTTKGCLLFLDEISKTFAPRTALDMGCGSGILAIAMAKLWPDTALVASDIDPESIRVTKVHADLNGCKERLLLDAEDGYQSRIVQDNGPYDVIVANILAAPLIDMAPSLAKNLKGGGYAILSGLLDEQKASVVRAHEEQGLTLLSNHSIEGWQALLMRKQQP